MKVLVTGGAGYIGSHTIIDLVLNKYKVHVVDNFSNSSKDILKKVSNIVGTHIKFTELDLLDQQKLEDTFSKIKPDLVIHFAGLKSVKESNFNPIKYYHVNVSGSINLLKAMEIIGCNSLIFSSSATVYGQPDNLPIKEDHKCDPINTYGKTKLIIEDIIQDWCKKRENNKAILLRYFNPAGSHPSGLIGENPKGIPNNLFPFINDIISGKHKFLKIYGNDYKTIDGTGVRDYIHISDLSKGHVSAINFLEKKFDCEIFNLGLGHGISVLEVVNTFNKYTNNKIDYKIVKRREGDLTELFADTSKAKKQLKWIPEFDLHDMVRDNLKWIKNNSISI